jgi:hypothetical protein
MNDRQFDEQRLDEWTLQMAAGADPLTAWAALPDDEDPPPPKGKRGCLWAWIIGLALGLLTLRCVF